MQASVSVQSFNLLLMFLSLGYHEVWVDDCVRFDQPCNLPGG